jgi:archaemetzincin
MKIISLVPVGEVFRGHLETLAEGLTARLGVVCSVQGRAVDASSAFNPQRRQYNSTEILKILAPYASRETWRVLMVTELDLFIPILTFVFGEAQLGGRCAVVSLRRLRQEFYGMPADPDLLTARLLKEALHELGHTLGRRHCPVYRCAMSSSNAVESIDLKQAEFCAACRAALEL